MEYYLPIEIVRIIYEYDSTYNEIFNKSINLIKNKKTLPFWCITWKMRSINDNNIIRSSGYGKSNMHYYRCNDICNHNNRNRNLRVSGYNIYYYPRFICDGI
jgi:hypothetical protein